MGKITINELHKSLYNYAQAVSDENLMTESKTVVNAINEIYGKQLIANAIGEPLNDTDTFTKMNDDINGLLSTFKTNMMNNGVTVETGDKFKSLIDKIATMVEEGSGKGIQYITNTVDWSVTRNDIYAEGIDVIVDDLTFKPSFVLVELTDEGGKKLIYSEYHYNTDTDVMLYAGTNDYGSYKQIYGFIEITDNGFNIHHTASSNPISYTFSITYHIIGVGEKDTTLSGGLDIISATQLPATGKENQICVITDNPVDNYVITSNLDDIVNNTDTISICQLNDKYDILSFGNKLSIANGNVTTNYYFYKACQGTTRVPTYVYQNNTWNQLTKGNVHIFEQGTYGSDFPSGLNVATGKQTHEFGLCTYAYNYGSYTGICFPQTSDSSQYAWFSTKDPLNFALYENLCMTVISDRVTDPLFNIYVGITENNSYTSGRSSEMISPTTIFKSSLDYDLNENVSFSTYPSTLVFDLSKITRTGRLLIIESYIDRFSTCLITNMWLE